MTPATLRTVICRGLIALWIAPFRGALRAAPAPPAMVTALTQLSLEELMKMEVSTVSRKTEQWWFAPGAIDVVTDEDIRRSAIQTIPDALRLATGVHVGQASTRWIAIGIHGFNVLSSNKINVQLVGRNLPDRQHREFVTPNGLNDELARSVTAKATWRF